MTHETQASASRRKELDLEICLPSLPLFQALKKAGVAQPLGLNDQNLIDM